MGERILEIKQMRTAFQTSKGSVEAIRGIDLYVEEGEILGIVGEHQGGSGRFPQGHGPHRTDGCIGGAAL